MIRLIKVQRLLSGPNGKDFQSPPLLLILIDNNHGIGVEARLSVAPVFGMRWDLGQVIWKHASFDWAVVWSSLFKV